MYQIGLPSYCCQGRSILICARYHLAGARKFVFWARIVIIALGHFIRSVRNRCVPLGWNNTNNPVILIGTTTSIHVCLT